MLQDYVFPIVLSGSRSPVFPDPGPKPHPRPPLRVRDDLIGQDRIQVREVRTHQGHERAGHDGAEHPAITGAGVADEPAETQRDGHDRERHDRDRVEVEQRAVGVGEPRQPRGEGADDRDAEPPVAGADPQDRGGDQGDHAGPPQGGRADGQHHRDAVVGAGAARGAGLEVVATYMLERARDDQPAAGLGVVGVGGVVDEVAGVEVPDRLLVAQQGRQALAQQADRPGVRVVADPSPGGSRPSDASQLAQVAT